MKYLVTLSFQDGKGLPYTRSVHRPTRADAAEAAMRMLRLNRNSTPPGMRAFDRWEVAELMGKTVWWPVAIGYAE